MEYDTIVHSLEDLENRDFQDAGDRAAYEADGTPIPKEEIKQDGSQIEAAAYEAMRCDEKCKKVMWIYDYHQPFCELYTVADERKMRNDQQNADIAYGK